MTYLAWLPVLLVVIIIHELGHFLVARWCGVKVDVFSIGFGPELVGFHDRHGTRWMLAAVPLGGYVKFADDENGASVPSAEKLALMTPEQRARSFHTRPLWQRAAVVAAGPAANFLSAIVLFALVAYVSGIVVTRAVVTPAPDGPAARAGIVAGDVIVRIDDTAIVDFSTLQRVVSLSSGRELTIEVTRDGTPLTFKVTPERKTLDDGFGGRDTRGIIGVRPDVERARQQPVYPSPVGALVHGAEQTWRVISETVTVLTHPEALQKISGLPTVIDVSNRVASVGIVPLVTLMAVLSVSIGFINLLPIPILDGGHLMFYAAEAVRGRPLDERMQLVGYNIGFALVMSLMALALWNDRFRVCAWFGNLFGFSCYS
jgi:regulator of sigma E protease